MPDRHGQAIPPPSPWAAPTTNADGTLTADGASADNYNVYYDGNGTLTLNGATINGTNTTGHVGAGIYAEGDLTIVLEGSSTVTGVQDPNGESQSIRGIQTANPRASVCLGT